MATKIDGSLNFSHLVPVTWCDQSSGGAGETCAHWKQMTAVWQYVPHNTFGLEFNHDHCEMSQAPLAKSDRSQ